MQPRRSLRLVVGALVLALPLLSSCGFDRATNEVYTPGVGTNDREGPVDVLAAVVVSAQPGSGTFIATLSNNSDEDASTFEGLSGAGEWQDLAIDEVEPVELPPRGFVNFAEEGGIPVTGDMSPGDVVSLTLSFDSGDSVTMEVPVVFACGEYDGLDTSAGSTSGEEPEESSSPSPGQVATDSASPDESGASGDSYGCHYVDEE